MSFRCQTHGVELTVSEENGRPVQRVSYTGYHPPSGCTLLHMTEPRAILRGEEWDHPVTGRKAYSNCDIREV